jgi:hypothetical protein
MRWTGSGEAAVCAAELKREKPGRADTADRGGAGATAGWQTGNASLRSDHTAGGVSGWRDKNPDRGTRLRPARQQLSSNPEPPMCWTTSGGLGAINALGSGSQLGRPQTLLL